MKIVSLKGRRNIGKKLPTNKTTEQSLMLCLEQLIPLGMLGLFVKYENLPPLPYMVVKLPCTSAECWLDNNDTTSFVVDNWLSKQQLSLCRQLGMFDKNFDGSFCYLRRKFYVLHYLCHFGDGK